MCFEDPKSGAEIFEIWGPNNIWLWPHNIRIFGPNVLQGPQFNNILSVVNPYLSRYLSIIKSTSKSKLLISVIIVFTK